MSLLSVPNAVHVQASPAPSGTFFAPGGRNGEKTAPRSAPAPSGSCSRQRLKPTLSLEEKRALKAQTARPRLPYFKHYKGEDMLETSLLSIEAVGVYHLLQVQYFYRGGLPNDEKKIRMISKMERDRRWPAIRAELLGPVFKPGWVKPEWDALVRETNAKSAQAKAAVRARYQPDPAPEPDYDSSIPF
jgi:hypothetical protein